MNTKPEAQGLMAADNVLPFAKSGGDETNNENWLSGLAVGTCFLCRPREDIVANFNQALQKQQQQGKPLDLMEYHVLHHATKSTSLYMALPGGQMHRLHVDTLRFSRAMELFDILGVTPINPEKEQEDDRASDPVPT